MEDLNVGRGTDSIVLDVTSITPGVLAFQLRLDCIEAGAVVLAAGDAGRGDSSWSLPGGLCRGWATHATCNPAPDGAAPEFRSSGVDKLNSKSQHSASNTFKCFTTMSKHEQNPIFQTVNHAKVIWDPKVNHKGIFGGHLNIRSLLPKCDEIKALLLDSNLFF